MGVPDRHYEPSRWHTFLVNPNEHRRGFAACPLRVVARFALLGAIILAVFAMHVLTAEGDHPPTAGAPFGTVSAAQQSNPLSQPGMAAGIEQASGIATAALQSAASEVGGPGDTGGGLGLLVDCVLFLVIAGSAVMVLMLVRRRFEIEGGSQGPGVWDRSTRGGPTRSAAPRLALCVIRV